MRMIYVDEAGTSEHEPVTIVAAIIINADKQYLDIANYLNFVRKRYKLGRKFVFHAKELYSGGRDFPREAWPFEARMRIMRRVLMAPRKFYLPIIFGYHRKGHGEEAAIRHQSAFAMCLKRANDYLKDNFQDEVGMVVAENVEHMKTKLARIPELLRQLPSRSIPELSRHPYDVIMDQVVFANKKDSPLLQLADHSAFALRRLMAGMKDGYRLGEYLANKRQVLETLQGKGETPVGMGAIFRYPETVSIPYMTDPMEIEVSWDAKPTMARDGAPV